MLLKYTTSNWNGNFEKLLLHQIYTGKKCEKVINTILDA